MNATFEIFTDLLKMGLAAAGLLYGAEIAINYVRFGEHYQVAVDHDRPWLSAGRLVVGAGILVTAAVVTLSRPLVEMLSEASAEIGEWALSKRQGRVVPEPSDHAVGRAA